MDCGSLTASTEERTSACARSLAVNSDAAYRHVWHHLIGIWVHFPPRFSVRALSLLSGSGYHQYIVVVVATILTVTVPLGGPRPL